MIDILKQNLLHILAIVVPIGFFLAGLLVQPRMDTNSLSSLTTTSGFVLISVD